MRRPASNRSVGRTRREGERGESVAVRLEPSGHFTPTGSPPGPLPSASRRSAAEERRLPLGAEHLHALLIALGHHALLGADGDWLVLYRVHVDRMGFQLTEVVRANGAAALLSALRERAVGMLGRTLP